MLQKEWITFEEAIFGCEKELEVILKEPCKTCNGTGAKPGTTAGTCGNCGERSGCIYTAVFLWNGTERTNLSGLSWKWKDLLRINVQIVAEQAMFLLKRQSKYLFPAGIDNGQSVRIRDKGEPGVNGGRERGDLLVEVTVSRHPIFQRQDVHIFSTAPITFAQAALGGDVGVRQLMEK